MNDVEKSGLFIETYSNILDRLIGRGIIVGQAAYISMDFMSILSNYLNGNPNTVTNSNDDLGGFCPGCEGGIMGGEEGN